LKAGLEWF